MSATMTEDTKERTRSELSGEYRTLVAALDTTQMSSSFNAAVQGILLDIRNTIGDA